MRLKRASLLKCWRKSVSDEFPSPKSNTNRSTVDSTKSSFTENIIRNE